ncbi:MAG: bifunctional folylpolyglutamate synthase/dihydrofolate synthase [Helicobacteraceae bacterium]|nr:bifunctional folylpolyglutamate synthase/dihydrofolate synthase [Helicobacteraceae bacterium]
MKLNNFLENKPLFYDVIDYDRFPRIFNSIKDKVQTSTKVIHLVGTNGKGSTGRFLAQLLNLAGKSVTHYSSPHILKFNERIWINGNDISDQELEKYHKQLQNILTPEQSDELSYFEYTTLLCAMISNSSEFLILEAGLGGVSDATNAFKKELSIFTPIALDHQSFLGDTIEEIATSKLESMSDVALISKQTSKIVEIVATNIATSFHTKLYFSENITLSKEEENYIKRSSHPEYLKENLRVAFCAMNLLNIEISIENIKELDVMFGRLSKISKNIYLDVGHNELAAQAIVKSLSNKKVILIFNSFADKPIENILQTLKPIIKHLEIIDIDDKRIVKKEILMRCLKKVGIDFKVFTKIDTHENYLVFGSFSVAEKFLELYKR